MARDVATPLGETLHREETDGRSGTPSEPGDAAVVLVVDDHEDTRKLYAGYLARAGFRVLEAEDGEQALRIATSARPRLIVMDLALPVLDGWAATHALKQDERTSRAPVLAFTGHAEREATARALAEGCASVLVKPCLPEALLHEVRRLLAEDAALVRADDQVVSP
jgi:CheY-like chemotaxis protein